MKISGNHAATVIDTTIVNTKKRSKHGTGGQMMGNPYPICENCIFVDEPQDKEPCKECIRAFLAQRIKPNFVSKRKPKTNADRIRAMSDEELAEKFFLFPCVHVLDDKVKCKDDGCKKCWMRWLREEAK